MRRHNLQWPKMPSGFAYNIPSIDMLIYKVGWADNTLTQKEAKKSYIIELYKCN